MMTPQHDAFTRANRRTFLYQAGGVALATSALLAGCGSGSGTGGNSVTLNVWGGVPAENGPAKLIEAFHKAHPNIQVKYTRFVNDDTGNTKLDTALQGGTPIDIYFSYTVARMSQRIKANLAVDLTSYVNGDSELSSWTQNNEAIFKSDNKYYSLPTTREPNFVAINKKMLDAAGLQLPASWTVSDYREMAKKLTSTSGGKTVYGAYSSPGLPLITLGPNANYKDGGKESNFDNPVFKQDLQLHVDMIKEKSAFPWTEVLAQNLRAYAQNPFLTGQEAMWITSPFSLRYVNDTSKYPHDFMTTFAPMPRPDNASTFYNGGSLNNWIMMHPRTKNKDAAWTFIRYWLGDGSKYMLTAGKNPVLSNIDQDTQVNGILGGNKATLYDVEAFKKAVFAPDLKFVTDTITVAGAQITQITQSQTDRCLIGEISPNQWVSTVKQQCDDAIKKAGA
ncbi:extracellular solute-binding protein [Ktedonobacter sp. SOSP1-52]|uniref:extracellular solute-binding protein n=1 Tax=Ktedonobacter sp. SOSP1-52 TaxID=2778366 RepID=UPI001915C909|nr:extracellular solute-binding protein [Ktedonobacter sp. SOSP1-52]